MYQLIGCFSFKNASDLFPLKNHFIMKFSLVENDDINMLSYFCFLGASKTTPTSSIVILFYSQMDRRLCLMQPGCWILIFLTENLHFVEEGKQVGRIYVRLEGNIFFHS